LYPNLHSFGWIPKNGMASLYYISIFSFLSNLYTVLVFALITIQPRVYKFSFYPHPCNHLLLFVLFFSVELWFELRAYSLSHSATPFVFLWCFFLFLREGLTELFAWAGLEMRSFWSLPLWVSHWLLGDVCILDDRHSDWSELKYQCHWNLFFLDGQSCWAFLHTFIENYLFNPFGNLLIGLLNLWKIRVFLDFWLLNPCHINNWHRFFSHSVHCLFNMVTILFCTENFLFNLSIYSLNWWTIGVLFRKLLPISTCYSVFFILFYSNFVFWGLTLRSLTHLELILLQFEKSKLEVSQHLAANYTTEP
jgi:hypothetical protein